MDLRSRKGIEEAGTRSAIPFWLDLWKRDSSIRITIVRHQSIGLALSPGHSKMGPFQSFALSSPLRMIGFDRRCKNMLLVFC